MKKTTPSDFVNLPSWLGFIVCSISVFVTLICLTVFPGAPPAFAQSPRQNHKVSVSDRQLAASLTSQGGRVIADYGSYLLLDVNDRLAQSLQGKRGAQIVDDYNKVLLNAGAIDTKTATAEALRATTTAGPGKQMRLIQFAAPSGRSGTRPYRRRALGS